MYRKPTVLTQKSVKICAGIGVCRATHTISGMYVDISLSREPHVYSSLTRSCFLSLPLISMPSCVSADQYFFKGEKEKMWVWVRRTGSYWLLSGFTYSNFCVGFNNFLCRNGAVAFENNPPCTRTRKPFWRTRFKVFSLQSFSADANVYREAPNAWWISSWNIFAGNTSLNTHFLLPGNICQRQSPLFQAPSAISV